VLISFVDYCVLGLTWALYNLAKHPKLQEKCREEVQSLCREQADVEW